MTAPALVTIITPSYNQATYLDATIRSVWSQDYPAIEHIILDGGSTDGSVAIIETWARDRPIRWRSSPDGGQAAAIAEGVAMATGQVIAWLNSDDVYLDPGAVSSIMTVIEAGAPMVTAGGWAIDEVGRRLFPIAVRPDRLAADQISHLDNLLQPATFVRSELMRACPLDASLRWAFDWDLFVRLSRLAMFTPLDRPVAGYRMHDASKTLSGGVARRRELLRVTERYHGRRSVSALLMRMMLGAEILRVRLPWPWSGLVRRAAHNSARFANAISGGRAIQY